MLVKGPLGSWTDPFYAETGQFVFLDNFVSKLALYFSFENNEFSF